MPLTASIRIVRILSGAARFVRRLAADISFTDVIYTIPTEVFRGDLLTLAGGGATALDGIATTLLPRPYLVKLSLADDLLTFKLRPVLVSDPAPGSGSPLLGSSLVYPTDYHAATNPVVWVRIS